MQSFNEASLSKILVVENHADTLKYLVMFLDSIGCNVVQARTMSDALQAASRQYCSILISDIGLPDGDGWQLMQRLKDSGHAPHLAIAISGLGLNADEERSRMAGFQHHLIKPFDPDRLEEILQEAERDLNEE